MKKVVFVLGMVIWTWQNSKAQDFIWAKQFFGKDDERCHSLAVDDSGNVYATGYFNDTVDFDPGPDTFNLIADNRYNALFIVKLDTWGRLIWAKLSQGTSSQGVEGRAITLDTNGNIYVTGYFDGIIDLDPGPDILQLISKGNRDIFIAKFNVFGNLVWAKGIGEYNTGFYSIQEGFSIAVDASGNVYTTGYFNSEVDFDPGPGVYVLTSAGYEEIFISKLDASGNFVWAKQVTSSAALEAGYSIAVDDNGNVFVTGVFSGPVFNLLPWNGQVLILKLDISGNLLWAKQVGNANNEKGISLVRDSIGNLYVTGFFRGTGDFDPGTGTFYLSAIGGNFNDNIFIIKLDGSGNLIWAKQLGGSLNDYSNSIDVDAFGNVFVTGDFQSTVDFDPGPDTLNLTSAGGSDAFVVQLNASGNFMHAWQIGGSSSQYSRSVAVSTSGNVYAAGYFEWTADFDPGPDTFNLSPYGWDAFVLKLDVVDTTVISGAVLTETGIPIPGVKINLNGSVTDSMITAVDGRYSFDVAPNGNYTITFSKNNDSIPNNGITAIDILLMRAHILGILPLSNPYKIIAAAEVNAAGDTTITTQDILFTRSLILGNITSFPTNRLWQFVSSDYVFPDSQHPFPFPTTRTYTNINTNQTNQNFIGIKLGDVNESWDPNTP